MSKKMMAMLVLVLVLVVVTSSHQVADAILVGGGLWAALAVHELGHFLAFRAFSEGSGFALGISFDGLTPPVWEGRVAGLVFRVYPGFGGMMTLADPGWPERLDGWRLKVVLLAGPAAGLAFGVALGGLDGLLWAIRSMWAVGMHNCVPAFPAGTPLFALGAAGAGVFGLLPHRHSDVHRAVTPLDKWGEVNPLTTAIVLVGVVVATLIPWPGVALIKEPLTGLLAIVGAAYSHWWTDLQGLAEVPLSKKIVSWINKVFSVMKRLIR